MSLTTIKVDSELRDRLKAEAAREGVPVGRVIESLLEDRARARRFAELKAAMAATPPGQRRSHEDETADWSATDSDGLPES